MLKSHHFAASFIFIAACFCIILPASAKDFSIKTNNPDALYNSDANAVFTVTLPSKGKLAYVFSNDGKDVIKTGDIDCTEPTVDIEACLGKAGFLYCQMTFVPSDGNETIKAVSAAGFEPAKIKPGSEQVPADFDEFWDKEKQELAKVPMNPILTADTCSEKKLLIYDVNIACVGVPVRGYYAKPVNASKGRCPAIVFFQGAGVYSAGKDDITAYGKEGFIALEINAHGVANGRGLEYYSNLASTTFSNYPFWGIKNRQSCYFTGMFLRVLRALEFIKAQPEWDGKHLVVSGASQGGAQALAAAGLDADVTFVVAGVPAMCDHEGVINGWPRLLPVNKDGSYEQILTTSKYIDCVNFARKAKAQALITVGFVDQTCRPTSVYAMYNSYAGPKQIINAPLMSHEWPANHSMIAKEQILAYLKKSGM